MDAKHNSQPQIHRCCPCNGLPNLLTFPSTQDALLCWLAILVAHEIKWADGDSTEILVVEAKRLLDEFVAGRNAEAKGQAE
jgi:hypothetical protein